MKKKIYLSAPLPFVGQKRRFAREFIKVMGEFPDATVFVDLFGGSGLLSHIAKRVRPDAVVVYNDFDNYRQRLENIPRTNHLVADLRKMIAGRVPEARPITGYIRERLLERVGQEEKTGFVDFITLSSSLMFQMNTAFSLDELAKTTLYNNIRTTPYPEVPDYLEGLEIVSLDYRELFARYKDTPGTVFIVDPPYLSTEAEMYRNSWRLGDYLDVVTILPGHRLVYFTSEKSSIVELCAWLANNTGFRDPFSGCARVETRNTITRGTYYMDIMLYTK